MKEPDSGDLPRDEGKLLFRWKPTIDPKAHNWDIPDEYAVFELSDNGWALLGGCIIYGKYSGKWVANVSARALVVHLLEKAKS